MDRTPLEKAQADGAHPSLVLDTPNQEDVERVWREYWGPMFRDGGLPRLKGELYDYYFLVDNARQVYRHVTGGLTDTLTASADGIIALADRRVEELTQALRDRLGILEGEISLLRSRVAMGSDPQEGA